MRLARYGASALFLLCALGAVYAAPSGYIQQNNAVCDPWNPNSCSQPAPNLAPVATPAAANNLVLKATPGNVFSVAAANNTATAGYLILLNATSSPADGAVTPLACAALPANGNASLSYNPGAVFSVGITAVLTSAAVCTTKTTGVITGFISGMVQ